MNTKERYYVLLKEYHGIEFVLDYDILAVSTNLKKLLDNAQQLARSVCTGGDPYLTSAQENYPEKLKDEHLSCWRAGQRFYVGFQKDPSTSISYRVIEKSVPCIN